MTARYALAILIAVLMVFQSVLVNLTPAKADLAEDTLSSQTANPSVASADYGLGHLRTNTVQDPGFEEYDDTYGTPRWWSAYGSTYKVVDASYDDDTHSGAHACDIRAEGTDQWSSEAYVYRYLGAAPRPYLIQGITLDFQTKVVANPDLDRGANWRSMVYVYNGSQWWYLRYYLSYSSPVGTNSSSNCYFHLNSTIGAWTGVSRNITADFEEGFSIAVTSLHYVYYVYWYLNSVVEPSDTAEAILDTVSLVNDTAYAFISNGGFESGSTDWGVPSPESSASVTASNLATEGMYAANLTSHSQGVDTYGSATMYRYFGDPKGICVDAIPGPLIEFDWWFSDVNNSGDPYAELIIQRRGEDSGYYTYTWYLGAGEGINPGSNSTYDWIMYPPGFGARESWNRLTIDTHEFLEDLGHADGAITEVYFRVYVGDFENSSVTLLVDDFLLKDYPTRDPGFEQDWYRTYAQPFAGWQTLFGNVEFMNYTTDSHAGTYAANFTSHSGQHAGLFTSPYVSLDPSMLTSFWWRLDKLGVSSSVYYALVRLEFNWSYSVNYVIAAGGVSFGNSSDTVSYRVTGFNVTGDWREIARNVTQDVVSAFGPGRYLMNYIVLEAYSGSGNPVSILFDDMHFVDGYPPEILDTEKLTAQPVYYSSVQVSARVIDNRDEIAGVTVHYSYSGDWYSTDAVAVGDTYSASIPSLPWDTEVIWYVSATDYSGNSRIDNNGGLYYSYSVGDDIAPDIEMIYPEEGRILEGLVQISAAASDEGSGIYCVQFFADDNLVVVDTTTPFTYQWDSRGLTNGTHVITARAIDNAGREQLVSHEVDVQNDVAGPLLSSLMTSPSEPECDEDVTVIVGAADATMIDNVTLYYRLDAGTWTYREMTPSGALYAASIPGQPWDTHVDYYVKAFDTFGQVTYMGVEPSPFTYVVTDSDPPAIFVSGPSSGANLTGTIRFDYYVADSGSGFTSLTVLVNGVVFDAPAVSSGAFVSGAYDLDTTTQDNGPLTIAFVVEDAAGNDASVELSYQVLNPQGMDAFVASVSSFISQYGFFVGAGAVLILFGVGRALVARRAAAPKTTAKGKR